MAFLIPNKAQIGYCTNVHAGVNLKKCQENLLAYSADVKREVSPDVSLGIGLWLAHDAAAEILSNDGIATFKEFLHINGFNVFTFNGFPFGNFHQPIVKYSVYEPNWGSHNRLNYTKQLATILAGLLSDANQGSISTLPLGWAGGQCRSWEKEACARQLLEMAQFLDTLEKETGKLIHVDIEPEPGCSLDTANDVVVFFKDYLLGKGFDDLVRRYLRVCHDICHSAVMFESQEDALKTYYNAGVDVGKVQVSSAIEVCFDALDRTEQALALKQLKAFNEPRYLHQTTISDNGVLNYYDDLSVALANHDTSGIWRVHFHVPIFVDQIDHIQSTQSEIKHCMGLIQQYSNCLHFEIETYAWSVLPKQMQETRLSLGIAKELQWFNQQGIV